MSNDPSSLSISRLAAQAPAMVQTNLPSFDELAKIACGELNQPASPIMLERIYGERLHEEVVEMHLKDLNTVVTNPPDYDDLMRACWELEEKRD